MTTGGHTQNPTLWNYVHVLLRRKWIILLAVVLVPAAAVTFSLQQQKLYEASAQVLLSTQNLAATLTGTQQTGITQDPTRIAQTQADVARVPTIAAHVLRQVRGTGLTGTTTHRRFQRVAVDQRRHLDVLGHQPRPHDRAPPRRYLCRCVHGISTADRHGVDRQSARGSRETNQTVGSRWRPPLGVVREPGRERAQPVSTLETLQTSNSSVVQQADQVVKVQPTTSRNGILGLVLGVVLGVGLAFLWESLDTRVRNVHEIGELLGGMPLLARLPTPSKKGRPETEVDTRLVMREDPTSVPAEAFRMLRTNLDFVTLDLEARSLMVTSAVEQEGKSTTVANLGIALARAGQRVVLVDLDLRRPLLNKLFGLTGPGVTQVALGHASLDQALALVAITDPELQQERERSPATVALAPA